MTTDTAVRVTRLVVQGKSMLITLRLDPGGVATNSALAPLKEIPYVDHPELKFNEHESTEMPFRYVKDESGKPIMPEVSRASYPEGFGLPLTRRYRVWLI